MQWHDASIALVGGMLIGAASAWLLLALGRIAGVSGILGGLLPASAGDAGWRLAFLAGLLVVGAAAGWLVPHMVGDSPRPVGVVALAGLLVGVGTRLASGCTSGHGVCGIARGSVRSIAATATFMATGVLAATGARLLGGGS
ncbi:MAG: YeeE/YedE thiosulfate transporter family protein [Myxococcota bacterium]|nr:YeeE/YedE thiosulfate transporter family protein [Myxococcota bacterium]